jgi:hypothetical protein
MYANAKMISVETVPGIGGDRMKESSGGAEFKYDIFDPCYIYKCYNIPQPSTIMKKYFLVCS